MATPKPQIRNLFATPVCIHFLPIANEANAELRPLILEKVNSNGGVVRGQGWRSFPDFECWGGPHPDTLMRVGRELAARVTPPRAGGRSTPHWEGTRRPAGRPAG